jgi:hypothetical protein
MLECGHGCNLQECEFVTAVHTAVHGLGFLQEHRENTNEQRSHIRLSKLTGTPVSPRP